MSAERPWLGLVGIEGRALANAQCARCAEPLADDPLAPEGVAFVTADGLIHSACAASAEWIAAAQRLRREQASVVFSLRESDLPAEIKAELEELLLEEVRELAGIARRLDDDDFDWDGRAT